MENIDALIERVLPLTERVNVSMLNTDGITPDLSNSLHAVTEGAPEFTETVTKLLILTQQDVITKEEYNRLALHYAWKYIV